MSYRPALPTIRIFAGPLLVTLGYFAFYYGALVNILRVKRTLRRELAARGERFDRYATPDKRMLAADRVQLNTLEHMPPFLTLLWLDAVLVSPTHAAIGGSVYLATRCLYPFVLGSRVGGDAPRRVIPLTFTGYVTLACLSADLVRALAVAVLSAR